MCDRIDAGDACVPYFVTHMHTHPYTYTDTHAQSQAKSVTIRIRCRHSRRRRRCSSLVCLNINHYQSSFNLEYFFHSLVLIAFGIQVAKLPSKYCCFSLSLEMFDIDSIIFVEIFFSDFYCYSTDVFHLYNTTLTFRNNYTSFRVKCCSISKQADPFICKKEEEMKQS